MNGSAPELPSEAATWERRAFVAAVGVLNLAFLVLDTASGHPRPGAVLGSRVALSAVLFWLAAWLGRPQPPARTRTVVTGATLALTVAYAVLGWATGGRDGPYLPLLPLIPLVLTIAIPDEPLVPVTAGVTGALAILILEAGSGTPPARTLLWLFACANASFYGWMGTFLFRRMRRREHEALLRQAEALRAAEEALARSRRDEALYRAMAASFPSGLLALFDLDLRFILADGNVPPGGRTPAELLARRASDLAPPDRAAEVEEAQRAALAGRSSTLEFLARGRVAMVSFHPVRDGDGAVILGLMLVQDITERRSLEERVATSTRLAALGTLVAGLAHEMNNPLGGAMASHGFALEEVHSLRDELASGRPLDREAVVARLAGVFEALEDGQASERRIAGILKDLSLLGVDRARGDRLSLPAVVKGALRWLPSAVAQRAKVSVEDLGCPEVHASEGQLAQVVVNLVTNAAKATPDGVAPDVRIRVGTATTGRALIEVTDNGAGMTPEVLARIFDPFFTTRVAGQGMGLGLPICHAIVGAHGGSITATSTPGNGSTFRIELPAAVQGHQIPN